MKSISVIIPCYNEQGNINETINKILKYFKLRYPNYNFELIIIDDGSTDKTSSIIRNNYSKNKQIQLITHSSNLGRGAAIKSGFNASKGNIVVTIDADLSYSENHIGKIIDKFENIRDLDAVIISAYAKGGIVKNVPFFRLFLSRIANWILSGFFSMKISTVTCLVRGYKGNLIRNLYLAEKGKEIHLEILRKLMLVKAKIVEMPGELIWKISKKEKRRKTNFNFFNAAKNHFLYALFLKPNKFLKIVTFLLLIISAYEFINIFIQIITHFDYQKGFWESLWFSINFNFLKSPHSFFIAISSLVIGLQFLSFMIVLQISKHNQDELLQHILPLLKNKTDSDNK